jgi:hypothetical protein
MASHGPATGSAFAVVSRTMRRRPDRTLSQRTDVATRAWAALAAALLLGCAHPAAPPGAVAPGERSSAPLAEIDGDWVLLGSMSGLRVSNGGALSYETGESRLHVQGYRVASACDRVVYLDATAEEQGGERPPLPPFARRARFLVVSDGVGLFTPPGGISVLAFRAGPVRSPLLGRYAFANVAPGDLLALDLGPRTVGISFLQGGRPELLPVLAVGDVSGAAATLVVASGSSKRLLRIFATPDGKSEIEVTGQPAPAQFTPAAAVADARAAKPGAPSSGAPPSPGTYQVEGLGHLFAGRIELADGRWRIPPFDDKEGFTATATLVGQMGTRLFHMHLGLGKEQGVLHLDLRPIAGSEAFVVSVSEGRHGDDRQRTGLMFRAGANPSWALSFGLDKDIDLLCTELDGLAVPVSHEAVDAAFERVGARAISDTMRALCLAAISVDASMQMNMVFFALRDVGRPVPSCAGIEKLRHLAGHQGEKPE